MAMVKTVSPSGWKQFEGNVASHVKIASGGLRGSDRRDFIKRAGDASSVFLPLLDNVKFAADEEPVHLIALGAYEAYGPNRNGDAFDERTCRSCHDTFVKFAKFYRNHKNKDPHISYGIIKASAYNNDMRRVELLVGLNKTKEAAERNGGFIADRELEKLASGRDLAVSMACRVPYDVCGWCNNKARTREEYCKEATCKAGGCAQNLTRLVKMANDVYMVHVRNESPTWFDMSDVYKPADRIAYGSKADYLTKAAAEGGFFGVGGAKMAEDMGVMAPLSVIMFQETMHPGEWTPYLTEQIKLAHGLHHMERNNEFKSHPEVKRAFASEMQPDMDLDKLGLDMAQPAKMAAALGALADQKIVLPLRDFARMTKRSELTKDAANNLPGVYSRMISDESLERRLGHNRFAPAEKLANAKVRHEAACIQSTYSLSKDAVDRRVTVSVLRQHRCPESKTTIENQKQANDSPMAEELARDYACYKVAALRRIAQFDDEFMLTCRIGSCQNHVV